MKQCLACIPVGVVKSQDRVGVLCDDVGEDEAEPMPAPLG